MTSYGTVQDVAVRLGRNGLDEAESIVIATRLEDAEALIRTRIDDLYAKVTSGAIRERTVVMVECEAVLRLIRNPDGMTGETDGTYAYAIDGKVASGRLTIEPEEWTMLGVGSKLGSISPVLSMPGRVHIREATDEAIPEGTSSDTAMWG